MAIKFIEQAHLENLKVEDLEDQMLSKKVVDIMCSPRRRRPEPNINSKGSFASAFSRGTPHTVKRNGYVKEVFWTNDFLQSLQKRKLRRLQSHTYEDLVQMNLPPSSSFFEEPDGRPEVEVVQEEEKRNYILGSP